MSLTISSTERAKRDPVIQAPLSPRRYPQVDVGRSAVGRNTKEFVGVEMLDLLEEGILLYGPSGTIAYENRAYTRLMETDSEREKLSTAADRLVREIAPRSGTSPHREPAIVGPVVVYVNTARASYRMQISRLTLHAARGEQGIMVSVARCVPEFLTEATMRERFGLTGQETRVALLMAQRRTNEEVAGALGISRHTAKRHVENVLFKLDVRSRGTVARKLMARSSPNG